MPVIATIASTTALSIAASAATPAAPLISCHLRSRRFIRSTPDCPARRCAAARSAPVAAVSRDRGAVKGRPASGVRAAGWLGRIDTGRPPTAGGSLAGNVSSRPSSMRSSVLSLDGGRDVASQSSPAAGDTASWRPGRERSWSNLLVIDRGASAMPARAVGTTVARWRNRTLRSHAPSAWTRGHRDECIQEKGYVTTRTYAAAICPPARALRHVEARVADLSARAAHVRRQGRGPRTERHRL